MKGHHAFPKVETSTPPSYHGTHSLSEMPSIFNLDDDTNAYPPQDMQFGTPQGRNCATPQNMSFRTPQSMNCGTLQSVATGSSSPARPMGVKAAKEAREREKEP